MREAGLEKIQRADDEDSSRTKTRAKRHGQQREELPDDTTVLEAPSAAPMELIDDQPGDDGRDDIGEFNMADVPDYTNFFEEVSADQDNSLEVVWNHEDITDNSDDHVNDGCTAMSWCLRCRFGELLRTSHEGFADATYSVWSCVQSHVC